MVFSDIVEVAIGLTFVFIVMSLTLTAVTESLEAFRRTRGQYLHRGIVELLSDTKSAGDTPAQTEARRLRAAEVAKSLYDHPLIHGLYRDHFEQAVRLRQLPSYIPSRSFALALIDQVLAAKLDAAESRASLPAAAPTADRLRLGAERIQGEALRRAVIQAVDVGAGDMERTRKHLEAWYDSAMDRVSGRYRRVTQSSLFWCGLVASLLLNVNALTVADSLVKDSTLRRAIAESASHYALPVPAPPAGGQRQSYEVEAVQAGVAGIARLGLPVGWSEGATSALLRPLQREEGNWFLTALGVLQIVLGYVMTALATTLGAPFWFDVLNKLMVVRATVKPHEKSPEEASQDHQDEAVAGEARKVVVVGGPQQQPSAPKGPVIEDADPVVDLIPPYKRLREGDPRDLRDELDRLDGADLLERL